MTKADRKIDPITLEILSHRLHEITREMGTTLERVGGTVNTTQMRDYLRARHSGKTQIREDNLGVLDRDLG